MSASDGGSGISEGCCPFDSTTDMRWITSRVDPFPVAGRERRVAGGFPRARAVLGWLTRLSMPSLPPLLETVRKACLPGLWSEGVRFSREGKVIAAAEADSYRVRTPGRAVAPTVTL